MQINDVLQAKRDGGQHTAVVTIAPDAPIDDLIRLLAEHNVGALIVSADGSAVLGIVSERDVVRLLDHNPSGLAGQISSIMTADVTTCDPHATVDDLMRIMTDRRIRHVPVVADGSLVGIVSIGDIVKNRIGQLEFERQQLESYIATTG